MNDDNIITWHNYWHNGELPPKCYHSNYSDIVLNEFCDKIVYNYKRKRWEKPVRVSKWRVIGIKTKRPRGWTYQPTYRGT